MGSKRVGLARIEKLLENLKREIDWGTATTMKIGTNEALGMTPEIIFKWNYITCGSPMFSHAQSSDTATADGHRSGLIFPGSDGSLYPAEMCRIGAVTSALETPLIEGTVPSLSLIHI